MYAMTCAFPLKRFHAEKSWAFRKILPQSEHPHATMGLRMMDQNSSCLHLCHWDCDQMALYFRPQGWHFQATHLVKQSPTAQSSDSTPSMFKQLVFQGSDFWRSNQMHFLQTCQQGKSIHLFISSMHSLLTGPFPAALHFLRFCPDAWRADKCRRRVTLRYTKNTNVTFLRKKVKRICLWQICSLSEALAASYSQVFLSLSDCMWRLCPTIFNEHLMFNVFLWVDEVCQAKAVQKLSHLMIFSRLKVLRHQRSGGGRHAWATVGVDICLTFLWSLPLGTSRIMVPVVPQTFQIQCLESCWAKQHDKTSKSATDQCSWVLQGLDVSLPFINPIHIIHSPRAQVLSPMLSLKPHLVPPEMPSALTRIKMLLPSWWQILELVLLRSNSCSNDQWNSETCGNECWPQCKHVQTCLLKVCGLVASASILFEQDSYASC